MMREWSEKQSEIIKLSDLNEQFILVYGAVGSGKTSAAIAGFIKWSLGFTDHVFVMIAKTSFQVEGVIFREVKQICAYHKIPCVKQGSKKYRIGNNTFLCHDGYNVTSVGRLRKRLCGLDLTGAYIDEVVNMPSQLVEELRSLVSVHSSRKMVMSTNPASLGHWFKARWVDRADELGIRMFHLSQSDNPSLPESYKESIKKTLPGLGIVCESYRRRILGEWD